MASSSKTSKGGSRAGTSLDTNKPQTWTSDDLRQYMSHAGAGNEGLFQEVYSWKKKDYEEAYKFVTERLGKVNWGPRLPTTKNKGYEQRQEIERACINMRHELFCRRQDAQPSDRPLWFYPELYIDGRAMESTKSNEHGFTIGYVFIAHCYGRAKKSDQSIANEDDAIQQEVLEAKAARSAQKTARSRSISSAGSQSTTAGLRKKLKHQHLITSSTSTPSRTHQRFAQLDEDTSMFDAEPVGSKLGVQLCTLILATVTTQGCNVLAISLRRVNGSLIFDKDHKVHDWDLVKEIMPQNHQDARLYYFLRGQLRQERYDRIGLATAVLGLWQQLRDPSGITVFTAAEKALVDKLPSRYHNLKEQADIDILCDLSMEASDVEDGDENEEATDVPRTATVERVTPPRQQYVETAEERTVREQQAALLLQATEDDRQKRDEEARQAAERQLRAQEASSAGGPPPVKEYPFMFLPADGAAGIKPVTTDGVAPVQLSGNFELEFVPWLSSPLTKDSTLVLPPTDNTVSEPASTELNAATAESGGWLEHQINADHMSAAAWQELCAFWDVDPTKTSPTVRAGYPGWNKKKSLKMYQCHAITWILKELFKGRKFVILAAAMGMGKTAMALAVCDISRTLQTRYGYGNAVVYPCVDPEESDYHAEHEEPSIGPQFNIERLVSGPITLHQGPTLIICPKIMEKGWISERESFIASKGAPYIVVARTQARWTAVERSEHYSRCFHWSDMVNNKLWPDEATLEAHYPEDDLEEWRKNGEMPVRDFLAPDSDGNPGKWQNDWWVITSSQSIDTRIQTTSSTPSSKKLDCVWSKVVCDEFDSCKSASAQPWKQISTLPGNPTVIGLSATPFTRLRDIAAAFIASNACFFVEPSKYFKSSGSGRSRSTAPVKLLDLGLHEHSEVDEDGMPRYLDFIEDLDEEQTRMIAKAGYFGVDEHAMLVDRTLNKKQDDEDGDATSSKKGKKNIQDDTAVSVQVFADWIRPSMIKLPASLIWQPNPKEPGLPAVDIPSHAHFQVRYQLEKAYDDSITDAWHGMLRRIGGVMNAATMAGELERFKVYLVFPMLYDLSLQDNDLDQELGKMTVKEAEAIDDLGAESVLWQYMDSIHKSRGMELQRELIAKLRAQRVTFGRGRKIIFAANKPFIAMVFNLYLRWLTSKSNLATDDIEFIKSWEKNKDASGLAAARFRSTNGAPGYADSPFILVGVASQICVGLNLVPATVVIILDSNWEPSRDEQLTGRVQRSRDLQTADKTYSFQCVPLSTSCDLALRMTSRSANKAQIRDMVIAAAKAFAVGAQDDQDDAE